MMSPKAVEKLVWVLIYGGLLTASLGLFVQRESRALGWTLVVGGAIGAAAGALLVWVRSRMKS